MSRSHTPAGESRLKIRLDRAELFKVSLESLERLAKFLEITISRKPLETDPSFKGRLVNAIQRWEKNFARKPRAK